jgi:hypothetical protein
MDFWATCYLTFMRRLILTNQIKWRRLVRLRSLDQSPRSDITGNTQRVEAWIDYSLMQCTELISTT